MRLMRHILLLAALTLLGAAPALAQSGETTEERDDRGILQAFLEDNLSDAGRQVRITGFAGALSSTATLDELTIADDTGVWITLRDVTLSWTRTALLAGRLEVDELSAGEIILARLPESGDSLPSPEATPFALPELPVSVAIDQIEAKKVTLGKAVIGQEVKLSLTGALQLAGGNGEGTLEVMRLDRKRDALSLTGSYSNTSRVLDVDIALHEARDGLVSSLLNLPGTPSIALIIKGNAPISDYVAKVQLETDGAPRLGGEISVQSAMPEQQPAPEGTDETGAKPVTGLVRFSADISGDMAPVFAPEYRDFFGSEIALTLRGARLDDGAFRIETLDVQAAALSLQGALDLGPDNWPRHFTLQGQIAAADGTPVLLPMTGPPTRLRRADVTLDYDQSAGDGWQAGISVEEFESDVLTLASGQFNGRGTIRHGEAGDDADGGAKGGIDGTMTLDLRGLAPSDPALARATGPDLRGKMNFAWVDDAPLELSDITLSGADYALAGALTLSGLRSVMDPRVQGQITLEAADLSRFDQLAATSLSGAAQLAISGIITPLDGMFRTEITGKARDLGLGIAQIDPLLAGETDLTLSGARDTTGTRIERLEITSPTTTVTGNGTWKTDASTANVTLSVRDAAVAVPGLSGPLDLTLSARQIGPLWTLQGRGTAPGGARVNADGMITLEDTRPPRISGKLDASADDLTPYSNLAGRALRGGGALSLEGAADLGDGSFDTVVDLRGHDLSIDMAEVDPLLRGQITARSKLARDSAGRITFADLSLGTAQMRATGAGNVLLDGTTARDATLSLSLDADSIAALSALAGRDLRGALQLEVTGSGDLAQGSFDGTLDATGRDLGVGIEMADTALRGTSRAEISAMRDADGLLRIRDARLSTPELTATAKADLRDDGGASSEFSATLRDVGLFAEGFSGPASVTGTAESSGSDWIVDAAVTGTGGTRAQVAGRIAPDVTLDLSVTGVAPLALANRFISPRSLSGVAQFALQVNGPPALSSVSGQISTQDAYLALPVLKLALNQITASLRLDAGRGVIEAASAVSTGGRMTAQGTIVTTPPFETDLRIVLDQVAITDPGLFTTTLQGQITLIGPATGGAKIAGALDLGEVELRVPDGQGAGIAELPGLRHINDSAEVRQTRLLAGLNGDEDPNGNVPDYPLDLLLRAPSRIFVRGRGLDAEMGGRLRLQGSTNAIIPQGQFDLIRGRLDILGKRLNLTEGYLRLQGSFDPFLHLVARTQSGDVEVIIGIDGLASEPEISFTSVPDLPEDEVISHLLFGRDLSRISPFQAVQLAGAVATLAGKGGAGIISSIRGGFDLDDLDVTTNAEGATEARVGKYLSDNLYSEIEVDSTGQSQINLNLELSPSVKARGSFGSDNTTGLGVFFEKDY